MGMTSIWRRPLGKKFWIGLAILCVAIAGLPSAYDAVTWLRHRTIRYRGTDIAMPFGWIYDRSSTPLGVKRPTWNGLYDSSLSVDKNRPTTMDAATHLRKWTDLETRFFPEANVSDDLPDGFKEADGHGLLCAREVFSQVITMHCLSKDAVWNVNYFGSEADIKQANEIVRQILSKQAEFRW
jgi:hypothetical protein